MNNNQEVCENCKKPLKKHWNELGKADSPVCKPFGKIKATPKPTPDPKVEQLSNSGQKITNWVDEDDRKGNLSAEEWKNKVKDAKIEVLENTIAYVQSEHYKVEQVAQRPRLTMRRRMELYDAKIASMEKELRDYKRALENVSKHGISQVLIDKALEAARKEQG